jgi:predicted aldo/keto reductase-like oxidoreductase
MARMSRRDFLRTTLAGTLLAGTGAVIPAWAQKRSATDWVALGNSGVKVTRLAFGTGTFGGRVQRELGQETFTRLVRYAHDHGIRFFETAEAYSGVPQMLATALKGIPRDSYRLMMKYALFGGADPQAKIDRFRKDLNSDCIDILLMHCMRSPRWPEETKAVQDAMSEAKSKKIILAHGASVHGLQALAAFPGNKWLDVALLRINHAGVRMDTPDMRDTNDLGDVKQVAEQAKKIHAQGTGVLGMKLIGEGQFTQPEQREAAMKFVMGLGAVDAVTIAYKSTAEIDEAMERMDRVLNAATAQLGVGSLAWMNTAACA